MSSPRGPSNNNRTRVMPHATVTRTAFQQEFNAANQLAEGMKHTNQVKQQRAQASLVCRWRARLLATLCSARPACQLLHVRQHLELRARPAVARPSFLRRSGR